VTQLQNLPPQPLAQLPPDRHVRRGQPEYAYALADLLPQGIAWPRWSETVLQRVVYGLAGVWGFVDGRAADLLERESDPRATVELLPDWERNWGLPDPCYKGPSTIGERQVALVERMTIEGAQSRQFFIDFAKRLGYTISITEWRPFMTAGPGGFDRVGDNRTVQADGSLSPWPAMIGPPELRYAWFVHVDQSRLTWFRASKGQCGLDPHLRIGLALDLECVIRRWKPAHTNVFFDYSGVTPSDPMAGTP